MGADFEKYSFNALGCVLSHFESQTTDKGADDLGFSLLQQLHGAKNFLTVEFFLANRMGIC